MSRRSPLGRALGKGSAKDGTGHWFSQRISAVALAPLGLWFAISVANLAGSGGADFLAVVDWLGAPLNTVLVILWVAVLAYHSQLGVQVVIEDYVHAEGVKIVALVLQKFAHAILATAGILAILRIALGT